MKGKINDNCGDKIEELLAKTAEAEGFRDYEIKKADGSAAGDGYFGIIKTINLISRNNDKALKLILKSASKDDKLRTDMDIPQLFKREIYMYDKVFSTFQCFEDEKGLPISIFTPKFYNATVEEKFESLILENLKESGYKLCERRIPLNEDHVCLVLSEYARLHALSFALKDQQPEKFKDVIGCMDDQVTKSIIKTNFIPTFVQQCTKAQAALHENEDREALEIFKAFTNTVPSLFKNLLEYNEDYLVALHGDCWINNMLFKHEDSTKPTKPTQVRFIDFQVSRAGTPVLDLSYFLYSCSTKEIINNLDKYLDTYYANFSSYLQKLGSDPNKLFPYSILKEHWKKYSRYGLILACLIIHIMLIEKQEAANPTDVSETEKSLETVLRNEISPTEQYKERIKPVILHCVKNKFI